MDEQEALEESEEVRGHTAERIYGLLSGTNNEDDNIYQILDQLYLRAWHQGFIRGAAEPKAGRVVFIEEGLYDDDGEPDREDDDWTLGACGCTDYHMADCPLWTV